MPRSTKISCYFFYSHNTNRYPDFTTILWKLGTLQSYNFSQLGSRGNYHYRVYFLIYLSGTSLFYNRNHSRCTSILLIKVIKYMLGIMLYWGYLKINLRCVTIHYRRVLRSNVPTLLSYAEFQSFFVRYYCNSCNTESTISSLAIYEVFWDPTGTQSLWYTRFSNTVLCWFLWKYFGKFCWKSEIVKRLFSRTNWST